MNKLLLTTLLVLCPYLAMGQSNQKTTRKAPLIGISCSHPGRSSSTQMTYTESVIQAGGTPILISITTDSLVLTDIANRLDGIILIGGGDIHPSYFNESPIEQLGEVDSLRDVYDMALIRLATRRNIPMFGICRGEQLINVAFGGTLYQDIPTQHPDTTVCHQQQEPSSIPTHTVHLTPGSAMASITGQTQLFTNTHHHQAVKQVAPGFSVTGWSSDSYSRSYRVFSRISDMGCAIPSRSSGYGRRQHLCQILLFSGSKGSYLPACQRDSSPHPLPRHAYRHPT